VSDEDEMESDKESKDDKSSSESDSDSEELMGSAGMSDSPKDTELELDSLGMIALEGETSSGMIERAVDVLDLLEVWQPLMPRDSTEQEAHAVTHSDTNKVPGPSTSSSEIASEITLGRRERRKRKVVDIGGLDDCLCGSRAEPTADNVIQCKRVGCENLCVKPF